MQSRKFDRPQRVVVVVGMGLALYVFGLWAIALGAHLPTGWTGYAPLQSNQAVSFLEGGLHPWVRLVIWLVLIAVWVGLSCEVLRDRPSKPEEPGAP
jgi:heme/copper-type cytochrome/quinol oxidase subunit 1